ncbi:hypothetical protein HMI56_002831, partial [Coelomomyces lativittatus]
MTEPICNPTPCRDLLAELLFEGYGVNELSLGIDVAFSLYENKPSLDFSGSILSISHSDLRKKSETQNRMRQMASLLEEEAEDFDFISNGSDKKRQRKKNLKLN